MEYFGKTVCATYDELTSGNDPVIKPGTLKSLQYRKRVDVISRGEAVEETSLYMSIPPYLNVTGSALSKSMVIRWS